MEFSRRISRKILLSVFFFVKFFLAELFSVRGVGDGLVPPKSGKEKFRPKTGSFCPKILILALFWTIIGRQFSAIFLLGGGVHHFH